MSLVRCKSLKDMSFAEGFGELVKVWRGMPVVGNDLSRLNLNGVEDGMGGNVDIMPNAWLDSK